MILIILTIIALMFLFISAVNFQFQKYKYRYYPIEAKKKLSLMESPTTWFICVLISSIILLGAVGISIGNMTKGFSDMSQQQNSENQYQDDPSIQNTDDGQLNEFK